MTAETDPDAQSGWAPVLRLDEEPLDAPRAVEVDGEELVILRHGERYVAMDRWCPHRMGDLAEGRVLGKSLKCPLHGFMYNLETGRGVNCPGFNVTVHAVRDENGVLSVRLHD